MMASQRPFVVTFYSYRGGVGRTMALANSAFLLAEKGRRVLVVDMDLSAPGLENLEPFKEAARRSTGFASILLNLERYQGPRDPTRLDHDLRDAIVSVPLPASPGPTPSGRIWFLPVRGNGTFNDLARLSGADWLARFDDTRKPGGFEFWTALKDRLSYIGLDGGLPDDILVSIAVAQYADMVISFYRVGEGASFGLAAVLERLREQRQKVQRDYPGFHLESLRELFVSCLGGEGEVPAITFVQGPTLCIPFVAPLMTHPCVVSSLVPDRRLPETAAAHSAYGGIASAILSRNPQEDTVIREAEGTRLEFESTRSARVYFDLAQVLRRRGEPPHAWRREIRVGHAECRREGAARATRIGGTILFAAQALPDDLLAAVLAHIANLPPSAPLADIMYAYCQPLVNAGDVAAIRFVVDYLMVDLCEEPWYWAGFFMSRLGNPTEVAKLLVNAIREPQPVLPTTLPAPPRSFSPGDFLGRRATLLKIVQGDRCTLESSRGTGRTWVLRMLEHLVLHREDAPHHLGRAWSERWPTEVAFIDGEQLASLVRDQKSMIPLWHALWYCLSGDPGQEAPPESFEVLQAALGSKRMKQIRQRMALLVDDLDRLLEAWRDIDVSEQITFHQILEKFAPAWVVVTLEDATLLNPTSEISVILLKIPLMKLPRWEEDPSILDSSFEGALEAHDIQRIGRGLSYRVLNQMRWGQAYAKLCSPERPT